MKICPIVITLLLSFFHLPLMANENPVILQSFYWYIPNPNTPNEIPESNLWQYIEEKGAKQFKRDGFTHIWLPPTGKTFSAGPNDLKVGYGVYDRYDLGEFHQMGSIRTKYGTKQQLHGAVDALHKEGLKVVADMVMNHIIGAYKAEPVKYSYAFHSEEKSNVIVKKDGVTDAYVNFDFNKPNDRAPRNGKYSNFVWTAEHFDGVESWNWTYLFKGKEFDKVTDLGDLTPLPTQHADTYTGTRTDIILGVDYDFQNSEVRDETIRWSKWLIDEVGFDGFRVDAIRHIHIPFVHQWATEIRSHMNKIGKGKNLLMFGEFWDGWSDRLKAFLEGTPGGTDLKYDEGQSTKEYAGIDGTMDLFDVPLHFDFQKIAGENDSYPTTRMYDLPERGLLAKRPKSAVTFVDNHDTVPTQELASYIPLHTKLQAYTFILLHEHGTPTVFYRDMYKGNFVSEFKNDNRDYLHNNIKKLISIRKKYAHGAGQFYRDAKKRGMLGYKRSGVIYLIREHDSYDNGIKIPTDGKKWKLAAGNGNLHNGTFYVNDHDDWAVWVTDE